MRLLGSILAAAFLVLALAAPAGAASPPGGMAPARLSGAGGGGHHGGGIYDQSDWTDQGTDLDVCGRYVVDWANAGHYVIRSATAATDYQFFYLTNAWSGHSTVTNPANGRTFHERWTVDYRDQNARRLRAYPGVVFAYEGREQGTYRVVDARGRTVYRDHGTTVTAFVFDTLGDSAPGGDLLQEPAEVSNTWDPDFDFCALADRLIG